MIRNLIAAAVLGMLCPASLGLAESLSSTAADEALGRGNLVPWQEIGGRNFAGWEGLHANTDGTASWNPANAATFRYPSKSRGWYFEGFRRRNDSSADWSDFHGLQFDVLIPEGRALSLEASIAVPPQNRSAEYLSQSRAELIVRGKGWQRVTLPWPAFDFEKGRSGFLGFISELRLKGKYADGKDGEVSLKAIRLIRAPAVALDAVVRGKAVPAGGTATYEVTVGNVTDSPQEVALLFEKEGWEAMAATVEPAKVNLDPGATATVKVTVRVPENGIPPGGHERQKLLAKISGAEPEHSTHRGRMGGGARKSKKIRLGEA